MENFVLQPNESVLYKGEGRFANKNGSLLSTQKLEIILTNLNLVFIEKTKKVFSKEQVVVEVHPIGEIKIYNGIPQIKQKNTAAEIYFINEEKLVIFYSKHELHKFVNVVNRLLTGKSMAVRGADKVKNVVNLVDDTLGVNTMGAVKTIVENGVVGAVFHGLGKQHRSQKNETVFKQVVSATMDSLEQKESLQESNEKETMSVDKQIEMVKKLKELLDAGIINQEEFEIKKKEIMNL